jgi:amino acid permease
VLLARQLQRYLAYAFVLTSKTAIFGRTTRSGVPIYALAATSSIGALCFGSSFVGSGELWGWLQNLVGVSNQVCVILCSLNPLLLMKTAIDRMALYWAGKLAIPQSMGQTRKALG